MLKKELLMSNLLKSESISQDISKNKNPSKAGSIVKGCLVITLGLIVLSMTAATSNLAKELLIRDSLQSIDTYTAFKNGKINYETFEYISEGRGQFPTSLESLMLMAAQRNREDFSGRDRTLMKALKGDNSFEIYQVIGSARELYDDKYRNEQNSIYKKEMSEKSYNKTIELQKTTLNDSELSALKTCSDKLIEKHGPLNGFIEMLLPRKQRCPEAVAIADNFLKKQKEGNNDIQPRQLQ